MLVGAAKEVSGGALGHQRSRIVTAVRQPSVRQAAVLGFVELAPWLSFARALAIPRLQGVNLDREQHELPPSDRVANRASRAALVLMKRVARQPAADCRPVC
jgi:hypothetical protein